MIHMAMVRSEKIISFKFLLIFLQSSYAYSWRYRLITVFPFLAHPLTEEPSISGVCKRTERFTSLYKRILVSWMLQALASPSGAVSQQHAHILSFHLLIKGSSLGFTKEKPANAAWSMESMSIFSPWDSRGFSFKNSLSKLLQSLGDFWEGKVRIYRVIVIKNPTVL